ncbi:MAG: energy-coupling factor transporter ATPase [Armatimonadota bacterium]|nr:energy-coupling factor transporter ATPase [Armatimonadota bacterium]MDR7438591.1 energy-coupling factor transporter ATPase [Armatimonadota bacterium]MDR7562688.1 energy-coupling factor transporter ATPase [Armatimonadota bacterium]MDR7567645.1 energy-coupling factor transporter ATPase [Armatimonadota bacterium]MDR7601749.1 energy-coupling factor transporter ATPase [Armatimonadota bacterium]
MGNSGDVLIQLRDVSYVYRKGTPEEVRALDRVHLTIRAGEFVALVGANGSGKSTLARLLNALQLPTEGEVWVAGMDTRDPRHLWEIRRRVGMVFQNPDNQIVATVVEEDVAFGPENLGLPPQEIAHRVEWALRVVGMWEHRHREPHLLSGGQKQRVAIAGVLAMRPEVLILDEATTMLDPQGRREVLETVQRLRRERITVLLITHDMDEAALAERVVVLSRGRIALDGSPVEVFRRSDQLRALSLDLPEVVSLAHCLQRRGVRFSSLPLTPEALSQEILRAREGVR